jgi:hypothetical protein
VSKVGVAYANVDQPKGVVHVTADLDTLLSALYVLADDLLPRRARARRGPKITDAELVCLAVAASLWHNWTTGNPGRNLIANDH